MSQQYDVNYFAELLNVFQKKVADYPDLVEYTYIDMIKNWEDVPTELFYGLAMSFNYSSGC